MRHDRRPRRTRAPQAYQIPVSAYHQWDHLAARIPALNWLDLDIRRSQVPDDYSAFWRWWRPLETRIGNLMRSHTRADWMTARGHLMRLADDMADARGTRR